MKIVYLICSLVLVSCTTMAQEGWKIVHNGKEKVSTSVEDESKNRYSIATGDLPGKGFLWIVYKEAQPAKDWKRVIAIYDENDHEIVKHGGNMFKIHNPSLASYAKGKKELRIFTWSLPTDPKVAATIRIRRVHLGTIEVN